MTDHERIERLEQKAEVDWRILMGRILVLEEQSLVARICIVSLVAFIIMLLIAYGLTR